MKTTQIMVVLITIITGAAAYYFMNKNTGALNDTKIANIKPKQDKFTLETSKTTPIEALSPTEAESNAYILEQLAELNLDTAETKSNLTDVDQALNEMMTNEVLAKDAALAITEPQRELAATPLKTREYNDSESEDDLIARLSKQTGMSESEIRDAFKGK